MSYLDGPRITFAGRFLADVPTINNFPENFPDSPGDPEPLWNPAGGGTFDFLRCRVTDDELPDGSAVAVDDPVRGLAVVGAADRAGAKLVDLDPEWQGSSELWGLRVRLVDPSDGAELLSGSFRVSAFRDSRVRQIEVNAVNGQRAGASFVSVLDDVTYGPRAGGSAALTAIRAANPTGRLSIVLNTFGYHYARDNVEDRYTTGSLTGCMGRGARGSRSASSPGAASPSGRSGPIPTRVRG